MSDTDTDDGGCPLEGCGLPYTKMYRDLASFSISHEKMKAAKVCIIPVIWNGDPACLHIYHSFDDIVEAARESDGEEDLPEQAQRLVDDDADPSHPDDLSEDHRAVFEVVRRETVENDSALLRDVRPAAEEEGVDRDKVEPILLNLAYHGFIEELENAVFKVPPEAVM